MVCRNNIHCTVAEILSLVIAYLTVCDQKSFNFDRTFS